MREGVVISLGGSVVNPRYDTGPVIDLEGAKRIANIIKETSSNVVPMGVVVGGGATARTYIGACRKLGGTEVRADYLGILATRLNATIVLEALVQTGLRPYPRVSETHLEALLALTNHAIVVMGGTVPGHTTDAVAAILCEHIKAKRFVNITNIDGVYTADPKKHSAARRIEKMDYTTLISMVLEGFKAGANIVIDPLAALILRRSNIKTYVVDGRDEGAIKAAILGAENINGTIIEG